jgi:hypothetical protein
MSPDRESKPDDEPRIILSEKKADEGWKEKAKKEKEKLADTAGAGTGREGGQLPPASILGLIEDLALRSMMALGQFRDPATGEVYLDLEGAKYTIDLLSVLEQKTKGNLDPTEEGALKDLLHNLRLTFVHVSKQAAAMMAAQGAGPGAPVAAGPGASGVSGPPAGAASGAAGPSPGGKQVVQPGQKPAGPEKPAPKIIF